MKTMTMKDKNKYVGLILCMFALAPWMLGACDDKLGGDTTTSIEFPTDTLCHRRRLYRRPRLLP